MTRGVKQLLNQARKEGWRVVKGKTHVKAFAPDGVTLIVLSKTPSGGSRGMKNTLAMFKRAGLDTSKINCDGGIR